MDSMQLFFKKLEKMFSRHNINTDVPGPLKVNQKMQQDLED